MFSAGSVPESSSPSFSHQLGKHEGSYWYGVRCSGALLAAGTLTACMASAQGNGAPMTLSLLESISPVTFIVISEAVRPEKQHLKVWRPPELSDVWWLADKPKSLLPSAGKLSSAAQLLTSRGLLLRCSFAAPVWVEWCPFCWVSAVEEQTREEDKVPSGRDCSFQGAGTVNFLGPDCLGGHVSSCKVVFLFVFCVVVCLLCNSP